MLGQLYDSFIFLPKLVESQIAGMNKDTKIIIGTIIATSAIIFGGVFLTNKTQNKPTATVNPSLLIKEDSYKVVAPEEKAVLVEFGDLQCPACGVYHPLIVQAREEFKDNLTYVFRNFPLAQHKNAKTAAYALEAAGLQDKYWEMQDKLYTEQGEWSALENPTEIFLKYAREFKLNETKFKADMSSSDIKKRVETDLADGALLKVNSTPTFFLNGVKIDLFENYEEFKKMIEDAMKNNEISQTEDEKFHAHFDLKVYENGKVIDFSQPKYQSTEAKELDHDIHSHDGNGKVVHLHKKDTTLGQFFRSINLGVTGRLFVNGTEVKGDLNSFAPNDLDRVLIVSNNTSESQIQTLKDSVSNDACIYSLKCTERGTPPPEDCVGGLGTGCE